MTLILVLALLHPTAGVEKTQVLHAEASRAAFPDGACLFTFFPAELNCVAFCIGDDTGKIVSPLKLFSNVENDAWCLERATLFCKRSDSWLLDWCWGRES